MKNMRNKEKQKIIDRSIEAVKINHEEPLDNGDVKLHQLSNAASKVAAEMADFETPWFQSLKLMVEAAGVSFDQEIIPVEGNDDLDERMTHQIAQKIPKKIKKRKKENFEMEFGHSGFECFKLFSRTRLKNEVGFAFLIRRIPISSSETDPFDLISVPDIENNKEFWLFSSHGVLYTNGTFSEFYSLTEWARRYDLYYRAKKLKFVAEFKLKKYFQIWKCQNSKIKFSKMRLSFRSKYLPNEIEIWQPMLAISTLIDELNNMELLPSISSSHWSIEDFTKVSSKTHLALAVMIENLFKFTATIASGTEVRLSQALKEAKENVAKLDRAPRSTKESWHVLRNDLKQAQRHLKRFENGNINYIKLINHTYYRISNVLLNVYRNQLRFIWKRINSKPILITTLSTSENELNPLPSSDQWKEAIMIHIGDVVPSIGLALQRAYHNSIEVVNTEDVKILEIFERKMFNFLSNDNECIILRKKIETKITDDLRTIQTYAADHCKPLVEATIFFNTYDNENIQDKLFTEGGGDYAIELFKKLEIWKTNITGEVYKMGCCTLTTKSICDEKEKEINSIFESIELGTQFRLRQELQTLEENSKIFLNGLEYETTEDIGAFADRLTEIDQKRKNDLKSITEFEKILEYLPNTQKRYKCEIKELKIKFSKISEKVENGIQFIKEPSKFILKEINLNMNKREQEADHISDNLLKLTNISIGKTHDQAVKMMEQAAPWYEKSCENHKSVEKLNHTISTFEKYEKRNSKKSEIIFNFSKNIFKIWSLVVAIQGKIERLKQCYIGSSELTDCLGDSRRILEEITDSVDWIETELPDATRIKSQISPFRSKLVFWIEISSELKLLSSAGLRKKEFKKFKIIIGQETSSIKHLKEFQVHQCKLIDCHYQCCNILRLHSAKMNNLENKFQNLNYLLNNTLIPISLNMNSEFYFEEKYVDELLKRIKTEYEFLSETKIELRDYYNLGCDDCDYLIVRKCFQLSEKFEKMKKILKKLKIINTKYLFIKRNMTPEMAEPRFDDFILKVSKLFGDFEDKMISDLEKNEDIDNLNVNVDKLLVIKRRCWPMLNNVPDQLLVYIYSIPFSISSIESILSNVLPGIVKIHFRQMSHLDHQGQVQKIDLSDESSLLISGLFFKNDTDPGFFIKKLNQKIAQMSKIVIYDNLRNLMSHHNESLYLESSFWLKSEIPSNLCLVLFDLYFGLMKFDLKIQILIKNLLLINTKSLFIINFINYIKQYSSNQMLYKSKLLLQDENGARLLESDPDYILANDEISINGHRFEYWPCSSSIGMIHFSSGLNRSKLLKSKFDVNDVFYNLGNEMSNVYSALLGRKLISVNKPELITRIPKSDVIFYISTSTETGSDFLVDYGLEILNKRVRKYSSVPIVSSSTSKVTEASTEIDVKGSVSMPNMNDDNENDFDVDFPIICLDPIVELGTFMQSITINAGITDKETCGAEFIKNILENSGLLGSRLIEERLASLISILEPDMTHSAFADIVLLARNIYKELDRTSTQSSSQSSTGSTVSTGKTLSESSSKTSQYSARSEALSLDYSEKINKNKNKDISIGLALFIKLNKQTNVMKDKLSAGLISNFITSIRRTLFERLWERININIINKLNNYFYFQYDKWNTTEMKAFNSFMTSLLIGLVNKQTNKNNLKILGSPISELLIILTFRAIRELKETDQDRKQFLKLVVDSNSEDGIGSGSSAAESISKIGISLLPDDLSIVFDLEDMDSQNEWLVRRQSSSSSSEIKEIKIISNFESAALVPPSFLWRNIVRNDLRSIDATFNISKVYSDHWSKLIEKWLNSCFKRFSEVFKNSLSRDAQSTSPYFQVQLSHWFQLNATRRATQILNHFLVWAWTQGSLPVQSDDPDVNLDNTELNRLLLVSFYWSFALGLPNNARSAFSQEVINILNYQEAVDISQSYLTPELEWSEFTGLSEYDSITSQNKHFIKSKSFLISKWLQSVLVPTNQTKLKSSLQLIGRRGGGKETLIFYFDKDHPKNPFQTIPAGSKRFKQRYKLNSSYQLIPLNLTQSNSDGFVNLIERPILSTLCTGSSTGSPSGYPFIQFDIDFSLDWKFILIGLIKTHLNIIPISPLDRTSLEESVYNELEHLITNCSKLQSPKLVLIKSIMSYIGQQLDKDASFHETMNQLVKGLSVLSRIMKVKMKNDFKDYPEGSKIEKTEGLTLIQSADRIEIKESSELLDFGIAPTDNIQILISQCLLLLQKESSISLQASSNNIGRRTTAMIVSKMIGLQYFEITSDNFQDQIDNAIRLNQPLLILCRQEYVTKEAWNSILNFSRSEDVFSLISIERILKLIDPKDYLVDKVKVRATALVQIQKKWKNTKVILAPTPTACTSNAPAGITTIHIDTWTRRDWSIFINFELKKNTKLDLNQKKYITKVISWFLSSNSLFYSPVLIRQLLENLATTMSHRWAEINEEYAQYEKNKLVLDEHQTKIDKLELKLKESQKKLKILQEELLSVNETVDLAETEYESQYGITVTTEQAVNRIEARVKELRRQTDISSQLHPLFSRAQAILTRLNERDFEEIRTYRAPPISVILVIEAVCILFEIEPSWENGTTLLHKDNFFQELEFYDKENLSSSSFRKMKQRLDRIDESEVRKASTAALSLYYWLQAINGFFVLYVRLRPIMKQLDIDEKELQRLTKKLGLERVTLDKLKRRYDELDEKSVLLTKDSLKQKSEIRRLENELEDSKQFASDLQYCSKDWQAAMKNLEQTKLFFLEEMLASTIFVFLIARFQPEMSKKLISSLLEIDKKSADHLQSISNRTLLLGKYLGHGVENYQESIVELEQKLKNEKLKVKILNWNSIGNLDNSVILLCQNQNKSDLEKDFIARFGLTCKISIQDKLHFRDRQIIEEKIKNFDSILYSDLTNEKYEYSYLKRLMKKRRKAREDWNNTLADTNSMIKNYKSFDLLDFALEINSIFIRMDNGKQLPSKVGIIQKSIDYLTDATECSDQIDRDQLVSVFLSSILSHVSLYCTKDENEIFKKYLILFLLEKRDETIDRDQLIAFLINGEDIDLEKYEKIIEDDHVIEHVKSFQFSPFVNFWKYSNLTSSDWIILYKIITRDDPFVLLESIALGGFQNHFNVESKHQIIPIRSSTDEVSWSLAEVIRHVARSGKTFKFGDNPSGCSIYLDKVSLPTECSIILSEDSIQYKTLSGIPLSMSKGNYQKIGKEIQPVQVDSDQLVIESVSEWLRHTMVPSQLMDLGTLYFLLEENNSKSLRQLIQSPRIIITSGKDTNCRLAKFMSTVYTRLHGDNCTFEEMKNENIQLPILYVNNIPFQITKQ